MLGRYHTPQAKFSELTKDSCIVSKTSIDKQTYRQLHGFADYRSERSSQARQNEESNECTIKGSNLSKSTVLFSRQTSVGPKMPVPKNDPTDKPSKFHTWKRMFSSDDLVAEMWRAESKPQHISCDSFSLPFWILWQFAVGIGILFRVLIYIELSMFHSRAFKVRCVLLLGCSTLFIRSSSIL
jgi:hypothetical protein